MTAHRTKINRLLAAMFSAALLYTLPAAHGTEPNPNPDAQRAFKLLERAEARLQEQGPQASASFSRSDEFVDGELYVYLIDIHGNFLASSGGSANLIGRNVSELTDEDRYPFIRAIIQNAQDKSSGQIEYRWNNPQRGKIESKIAQWRRVGDQIAVIGYYNPHPSFEMAKSLLWRAVHTLKINGEAAFDRFNSLNGGFVQDDLYVFVIGLDDGKVYAHGGMPRQVGRNAHELVDVNGKRFGTEMIELARSQGEGEIDYVYRNPLSLKNEPKRTYIVRTGNYLLGVGAYQQ